MHLTKFQYYCTKGLIDSNDYTVSKLKKRSIDCQIHVFFLCRKKQLFKAKMFCSQGNMASTDNCQHIDSLTC